jgi:hypothetical protein
MKMEQTECSATSAYKIQTPENYPEERMQQAVGYIDFWLMTANLFSLK